MRFIIILFLGIICSVSVMAQTPYRLMIFGDSLSAGYRLPPQEAFYSKLQKALQDNDYKNVQIIHQSKSGETTAGGLSRLPQALTQNPEAVLLELGVNDALRNVPIKTIQTNLQNIIDEFEKKHIPVLLIGMQIPPIKNPVYAKQFTTMYATLAKKNGLILYPFFMKDVLNYKSILTGQKSNYTLGDNLHPNAKGIDIMVKNILPNVIKFLHQNGVKKSN
ncbi:MAG: arylesterase [Alphaproteobacteria bacterium]|nr:arylesterase [Alphaproteobacteria bacterium]